MVAEPQISESGGASAGPSGQEVVAVPQKPPGTQNPEPGRQQIKHRLEGLGF